MFRKILVCSDTSPASDLLIQCAGELKAVGVEEIVLAHVLEAVDTEGLDLLLADETRPILDKQREALEQIGIRVITEMPISRSPARTLAILAEEHDVSAIFIGSRGKGIIRSALLGSVTTSLLQQAERPVLIARISLLEGNKCHIVCGNMFARILFATDFSEAAEQALKYLGKIAADTKCPVTIMHVLEGQPADAESAKRMGEDSRFLLEAKKRRLESLGASAVSINLVSGEPAKEILARAKEEGFSLIVMGSTGKGFVKGVLIGSVSNEVCRHAGLPVLLIPAARE